MILIDANILMYAAGASHPNKAPSVAWLGRVAKGEIQAAVDAGTLQEILHRYRALGRWQDGRRVYDPTRRLVPSVLAVTADIVDETRDLLDRCPALVARDAVHAAVVRVLGLDAICSYDRDLDAVPGLRRVEPPL